MKKGHFTILLLFFIVQCAFAQQNRPPITVNVLAIGNQITTGASGFTSVNGVNESADAFLEKFKPFSMVSILRSAPGKPLKKAKILEAVQSFVSYVEHQDGKENWGIIYYCGHGLMNAAGSSFWIPGDLHVSITDSTYELLQEHLLNLDTLRTVIIDSQMRSDSSRSRYIVLSDCCSEVEVSHWYSGIKYEYKRDSAGNLIAVVTYDSAAIKRMSEVPSILSASAGIVYNTLFKGTNEMILPGEMIRMSTFTTHGNGIIMSAPPGGLTKMVKDPRDSKRVVGPICRRTLKYFDVYTNKTLDGYFKALLNKDFDDSLCPVLVTDTPLTPPDESKH